jgi:hypothetical protein
LIPERPCTATGHQVRTSPDNDKYELLALRFEQDVRELMVNVIRRGLPQLSESERVVRAHAVFDVLVASTAVRALTRGLADRETFCARTGAWNFDCSSATPVG